MGLLKEQSLKIMFARRFKALIKQQRYTVINNFTTQNRRFVQFLSFNIFGGSKGPRVGFRPWATVARTQPLWSAFWATAYEWHIAERKVNIRVCVDGYIRLIFVVPYWWTSPVCQTSFRKSTWNDLFSKNWIAHLKQHLKILYLVWITDVRASSYDSAWKNSSAVLSRCFL